MAVDQDHPSIPLLSRLDHLDFMMKYMEGKGASMAEGEERGNGGRRESGEKESKLMPLDLALQQTLFKGSLLDRVASLENRLFQLCLDMDCGRVPLPSSSQSSTQTTGSSSSSYASMAGGPSSSSSSYPIFNLTPHGHRQSHPHPNVETHDKEKSEGEEGKGKTATTRNQKKKKKTKKNIKMSDKSLKKLIPWPHLKILGC